MVASKKPIRTPAEIEAVVREFVRDWADFFGVLHQWTLHLTFVSGKDLEDSDSKAETSWATNYTSAEMKFNTNYWKKNPCDCDLEETAAHEVGHLVDSLIWDYNYNHFSGTLRREISDMLERQCDVWTRIAIRARYGDDYRCSRCSELLGSDESTDGDTPEGVRGEAGDSGRIVRDDSPITNGSSTPEWLRNGSLRMDNRTVFPHEDS